LFERFVRLGLHGRAGGGQCHGIILLMDVDRRPTRDCNAL